MNNFRLKLIIQFIRNVKLNYKIPQFIHFIMNDLN